MSDLNSACSEMLTRLARLAADPARIVCWRGSEALHAARLADEADRWQRSFAELPAGQPVAIYFHDSFSAAAALLGAWQGGRTVILPGDVQSATVQCLREQMQAWLVGDIPGACSTPPAHPAPHQQPLPPLQLRAEQPGLVVFTSGSSGNPVAIKKTLGQICSEVAVHCHLWGHELRGRCVVATVSHQHIYGLLFRLLLPLLAGSAFVAERLEYPEEVEASLALRPSVLVSSPAFLKRLTEGECWQATPSLVFSSGGPLSAEAALRAEQRLVAAVIEIYGSSETGGIAWRRQSVQRQWTTLPEVRIDLDAGLLTVRSPFTQGGDWHRTSDRASMLEHGFLLEGRADRLVKIEEKRVSLDGIEAALLVCPDIHDVRVVVLPGERARLGAAVVLSAAGQQRLLAEGKRALNEQLRALLLQHVERIALPRYWRYVPALPHNSMGKITQASLQALFETVHDSRYPPVISRHTEVNTVTLELAVEGNLPWFDGHFPGLPILPGVAILHWVEYFGRQEFPLLPAFMRMDVIKFQQVIRPGTVLRLQLDWLTERNAVSFRATSAGGPNASGRLSFGAESHV